MSTMSLKIFKTTVIASESSGIFGGGGRSGSFGSLITGISKSILRLGSFGSCGIGSIENQLKVGVGASGSCTG